MYNMSKVYGVHSKIAAVIMSKLMDIKCHSLLLSSTVTCAEQVVSLPLNIPSIEPHNFRSPFPLESWQVDITLKRLILRAASGIRMP